MGGHLPKPAQRIRQLHLAGRFALGLEQAGAHDKDGGAAGAGRGDVEAVQAVEELQAAGASSGREVAIE